MSTLLTICVVVNRSALNQSAFKVATSTTTAPEPILEACIYLSLGNTLGQVTHCIQTKGAIVCDIYTGAGYHGPSCMEHVATFFNTDGIQPFRSSHPQLGLFLLLSLACLQTFK